MKLSTSLLLLLAVTIAIAPVGCRKKKSDDAKPAGGNGDNVPDAHAKGPNGGPAFDIGDHKYRAEILVKEGKVHLYILDHDDNKVAVPASDKQIKVTAIKHEGKSLPDFTLAAKPLEGEMDGSSSHFEASGDAVKDIKEAHALNGAKFKVTIKGEEYDVEIKAHEHHDDE